MGEVESYQYLCDNTSKNLWTVIPNKTNAYEMFD
jgi:hypothetical protein